MFPHTITIFQRKDNSYKRTIINGVIWYGSNGLVLSGKGIQDSNSINVLIPRESLANNGLSTDFNINKDDLIVKGEVDNIEKSSVELNKYKDVITVMNVNDYGFGSGLDCILIGGN